MCNWARGNVFKGLGKREPKNIKPKEEEIRKEQEDATKKPRWSGRRWRLTAPDRVDVRFARNYDQEN